MSMQSALYTSAVMTADSPKGQRAAETFRAQYNKARLDDYAAQTLNEHPGFAAYIAAGIRQFSAKGSVLPVYLESFVGGKSEHELVAELVSNRFSVSDSAKGIMSHSLWEPGESEKIKFARIAVRDLGFTDRPTTDAISMRIKELGHSLCKPGDGPAIRRALMDQLHGDSFWIIMERITNSRGNSIMFVVSRDIEGTRWLRTDTTYLGRGLDLHCEIVFRLYR